MLSLTAPLRRRLPLLQGSAARAGAARRALSSHEGHAHSGARALAGAGGSCRACCTALERELHQGARAASPSGAASAAAAAAAADTVGDPVFSVSTNAVRYGRGALREVGGVCRHALGPEPLRRVALFTDRGVAATPLLETVLRSLEASGVEAVVYDRCRVEPTDVSVKEASEFLAGAGADGIVSLGGGSVMDTAKAAQLYASLGADALRGDWHETFLDYVNAPIGRARQPAGPLLPHVACPTTSGTGSESTGLAIFDLTTMHAKTAVASPAIRPALALVDPDVTDSLPAGVCAASSFDVLSHALESYTARPHTRRALGRPRGEYEPSLHRPLAQGQNAYSDVGCLEALRLGGRYMLRAVHDASDAEARERMMFASLLAGISFGNCGVAVPHGCSYSVSGLVRDWAPADGYPSDLVAHPIVPHGVSVVLSAPSAFRFTAEACPERHLEAAAALGADGAGTASPDEAGDVLAERLIELMRGTGHVPSGLAEVGFGEDDLDALVAGALPQRRVLDNAPRDIYEDELRTIFRGAMKYW